MGDSLGEMGDSRDSRDSPARIKLYTEEERVAAIREWEDRTSRIWEAPLYAVRRQADLKKFLITGKLPPLRPVNCKTWRFGFEPGEAASRYLAAMAPHVPSRAAIDWAAYREREIP